MDQLFSFDSLLSVIGTIVALAFAAWYLVSEALDMHHENICYFLEPPRSYERKGSGKRFLQVFAILLLFYGVAACAHYRNELWALRDKVFLAVGLFMIMLAGMVVQVIANNFRNGRDMFDVTTGQLLYPMLFSVIVYYPIWVIAGSQQNLWFSVYAAFLNGYFWESVVSEARPPQARPGNPHITLPNDDVVPNQQNAADAQLHGVSKEVPRNEAQ